MIHNFKIINEDSVYHKGDWGKLYICPECGDAQKVSHDNLFFIDESFCKKCSAFINKDKWNLEAFYLVRSVEYTTKPIKLFNPSTWFATKSGLQLHSDWVKRANKKLKKLPIDLILLREEDNEDN